MAADAALEAINCAKENGHEKLYTFSLPINSISAATRKLLDIGEAVTEKWNEEIIWGSTRNVNGLQTVAMAKHTKGSHYNARSVLGPTLSVAEAFYSSNGVPISEDNSDFWTANYPNRYEITTIPDEMVIRMMSRQILLSIIFGQRRYQGARLRKTIHIRDI